MDSYLVDRGEDPRFVRRFVGALDGIASQAKYQAIGNYPPAESTDDISNASPERLSQSALFTVRYEWHRQSR